ncbi:uncharacterized protein TNCV_4329811 [Trichonephila clavipes]|nr:uncharacterized protein TNCV_4329811 [Trichonephila clavipes]
MLNLLRLKRPSVGQLLKLGEVVPVQVVSSSLDQGAKEHGKLLPSFYQASSWVIAKSFGLTVIDCMFFFATGGVATYLAFWKSLFIIVYHIIFGYVSPKSNSIISREETCPEVQDVSSQSASANVQGQEDQRNDASTGSDVQQAEAAKSNKGEQQVKLEETPNRSEHEREFIID